MRPLITAILILTSLTTLTAQSSFDSLILTEGQNNRWILKLEKEVRSKKLEMIKHRILLDTNIYIRNGYPDRLKVDSEKQKRARIEGYGKPLLIFNGQFPADINNNTKNKSIIKLTSFLIESKIKDILVIKDIQARALYGRLKK
jgi:hypothetical protein